MEKLSYGAGELASNLSWNMAAGFLLIYYTDVALLPVASLGVLMLVTRVLDAIFDPLAGLVVDRTRSRKGKARPYLLYGVVPFGLLFVATFSVPQIGMWGKIIYAYVTFTLLGLLYAFLYVPYSALLPMLTRRRDEKTQLGSYRAMATSLASILAYGAALPLINLLGGANRQQGYMLTAAVMAVVTGGLYWLTYANCKERHTRPLSAGLPLRTQFARLLSNRVWLLAFIGGLLIFIKIGVMVSSLAFFVKDVMGRPGLVSVILPLMSVMIFIGGAISRPVVNRFGIRRGTIGALLVSSLLVAGMAFAEGHVWLFVGLYVLANVVGGIQAAALFILGADAVDWHEAHYGERNEGLTASGISFGLKVGIAIGAAGTAFALGAAGYDPAHASAPANTALRWLTYGAPLLLNSLLMLCWSRCGGAGQAQGQSSIPAEHAPA
ncbi:MAG TPA: glycoside-pentoside-hexuronide (GPH):cation symporter [Novosphingobium sp.]|nr:glycoside-pentoside-hexuronide (GPH):cation symporter [Novosphingobium sp.]